MHAVGNNARLHTLLHSAYASAQVRDMERPLLERGVPLMRMAASAAAHVAVEMLDEQGIDIEDADVVLLAGAGDNGGDGLFAGAALADEGARVTCVAVGRTLHEAGYAAFAAAGGRTLALDPASAIPGCESGFSAGEAGERLQAAVELSHNAHLVIDAMTGIGLKGALRGLPATIAASLGVAPDEEGLVRLPSSPALPHRESSGDFPLVLAIDTPSGVGVDDGALPGPVIPADRTVTFGALKPCAMLPPATFACGAVTLVDFDFDLTGRMPAVLEVDENRAADAIRLPRVDDTKYSRGVAGLVTGSERYPGAAVLSARAAAAAGVGMVRYLGPARAQDMLLAQVPEAVMGKGHVQAWAVGSGVPDGAADRDGSDLQRETIARLLAHYELVDENGDGDETDDAGNDEVFDMPPIVVDAGALDLLPDRVPPQVVLTPHAGELAKLINRLYRRDSQVRRDGADGRGAHASPASAVGVETVSAADVMAEPLRFARIAAEMTGATVLLKGAVTLVTVPEGTQEMPVLVSGAGPAWLATAGAGDVLAGTVAALLAQNADDMDEFTGPAIAKVVAAGATVHGLAAQIASESDQRGLSEPELFGAPAAQRFSGLGHPIVASDVARAIPEALSDLIA